MKTRALACRITFLVFNFISNIFVAIAFMGYVLPFGQMSFWGATVITNLLSPFPSLIEWVCGGHYVYNPTLKRFFVFHFIFNFHLWTSSLKTVSLSVWSHVLRILMAPPCRLTFQNHTFTRLMDYNNGFSLSPFFLSLHSFLWIGSQFPQEKFLSYGRILTLYYYFLLMCILFSQDYYYIYFFWKFIIRNGLQDEMEICLASH